MNKQDLLGLFCNQYDTIEKTNVAITKNQYNVCTEKWSITSKISKCSKEKSIT